MWISKLPNTSRCSSRSDHLPFAMEHRKQHLLFETQCLTPGGRAHALQRLFSRVASQPQSQHSPQYVPQDVLAAHGELESRLRHLLNAATLARPDRARLALLRKIDKRLTALPTRILSALSASTEQDWMVCYRSMIELHELLEDAHLVDDAQEYATLVEIMTRLAHALSQSAAVRVDAASMFVLWIMQVHLQRYSPRRKRRSSRRKTRPSARHASVTSKNQ